MNSQSKTAAAYIVITLLSVFLFLDHFRGVLFFDEWGLLLSLQESPNVWKWILTPVSGHFTPTHKLLFAALYELFGAWFLPFKIVSFLLYLFAGFLLVRIIPIYLGRSSLIPLLVFALYMTTAAFSEVVSWSNHYREQIFLIGVLGWILHTERYFNLSTTRPSSLSWPIFFFLLVTTSLSNPILGIGVIGIYFGIIFAFRQDQKKRFAPFIISHLILSLILVGYLVVALRPTITAQLSQETTNQIVLSWETLGAAIGRTIEFIARGIIFPFLGIERYLPSIWQTFLATFFWFIFVIFAAYRAQSAHHRRVLIATSALLGGFSFLQLLYRPTLSFVLEWNKYAYIPGAFFMIASAIAFAQYRTRIKWYAALLIIVLNAGYAFRTVPNDYQVFTRSPEIKALISDFENTFTFAPRSYPVLYNSWFDWGCFLPNMPVRLHNLWGLSRATRDLPQRFFDEHSLEFKTDRKAFEKLLDTEPMLRSFYLKYRRQIRVTLKDQEMIPFGPLMNDEYWLLDLSSLHHRLPHLQRLEGVWGTFARSNSNTVHSDLVTESGEIVSSYKISASTLVDNRTSPIWSGEIQLTDKPLYLRISSPDATASSTEALYIVPNPNEGQEFYLCKTNLNIESCKVTGKKITGTFVSEAVGVERSSF